MASTPEEVLRREAQKSNEAVRARRAQEAAQERAFTEHPLGEMDLLISAINPTRVEAAEGKTLPVYEVTLGAVWPEAMGAAVLAAARDHRIRVRLLMVEDVPR